MKGRRWVYRKAQLRPLAKGSHPTDDHVDPMAKAIEQATADFAANQDLSQLEADLNDTHIDFNALGIALQAAIAPMIAKLIGLGATTAAADVFNFALPNPLAVDAAGRYTAHLVTEINAETRAAIQGVILRGFEEGLHPYSQARLLRSVIGLTSSQAQAAQTFRQAQLDAGTDPSRADELYTKYSGQLLRQRANLIARTETIRASAIGQRGLWNAAVANGYLDPAATIKVWSAANDERVCSICDDLDQQESTIDGGYGEVDAPPAHPGCRCSEILRFPSRSGAAGNPNDGTDAEQQDFSDQVDSSISVQTDDAISTE